MDNCKEEAVAVVFPGFEDQLGAAHKAFAAKGLLVKHLVWLKGKHMTGAVGPFLNYSTEDILLGFTQPDVS